MSEVRVSRDVIAGDVGSVRLDAGAGGICLVKISERWFAIGDRCSHADVSLAKGDVDAEECSIECIMHGSAFSLLDGQPQSLPATTPVPVYAVRVEGAEVVVTVEP